MTAEIALVNMPFFSISRPSLGLSLLRAGLERIGYSADIHYLNLLSASIFGHDLYLYLEEQPRGRLALEWIFMETLWGSDRELDQKFIEYITNHRSMDQEERYLQALRECRSGAERCIETAITNIPWDRYRLVGFSSMFQQQMASLSLARRLKELYPDLYIIFGGANCESVMGAALLKSFPFIDGICLGEGDVAFPQLVQQIFGNEQPKHIPGILQRRDLCASARRKNLPVLQTANGWHSSSSPQETNHACGSHDPAPSVQARPTYLTLAPAATMDELPYPNFDDYFAQAEMYELLDHMRVTLPFETSRGCWWGEHHHCTFCGLNGMSMKFRHKSSARAIDEVKYLVSRYGSRIRYLAAADNIMPMSYFNDFVPSLGELGVHVFYETKANLREDQVAGLKSGNVRSIQPGIESLSTPVLNLMRKGVTAIQNLQLLKFCGQYGIDPSWNFLIGFPGESAKDYEGVAELIRAVPHFRPPDFLSRVRFDRFSPYFTEAEKLGVRSLTPFQGYRYLYSRLDEETINDLAYFFTGTFEGQEKIAEYEPELAEAVHAWKEKHPSAALFDIDFEDFTVVCDFRSEEDGQFHLLKGPMNRVYKEFHKMCSVKKALAVEGVAEMPASEQEEIIDYLETHRLVWRENQNLLSLAVPLGFAFKPAHHHLERLSAAVDSLV
ncbi:MAG TPA: RiPP maturation radical SAM C-methyltransferase [Pyrinomonadaceae bacterium]|nr:RiPP maturation radical SAM C-methyltransferase [Pyrinomonadaceae bacterium]